MLLTVVIRGLPLPVLEDYCNRCTRYLEINIIDSLVGIRPKSYLWVCFTTYGTRIISVLKYGMKCRTQHFYRIIYLLQVLTHLLKPILLTHVAIVYIHETLC